VQIPEHTIPAFKPSVEFAELVRDKKFSEEKQKSGKETADDEV
jgi:hypothetical protein